MADQWCSASFEQYSAEQSGAVRPESCIPENLGFAELVQNIHDLLSITLPLPSLTIWRREGMKEALKQEPWNGSGYPCEAVIRRP